MSFPRKKRSGLTGLELNMALTTLQSVKTCLREHAAAFEANPTDNDTQSLVPFGSEFEEILDKMLDMVAQKLDGPQALSFSGVTFDHLHSPKIELCGRLELKSDYEARAKRGDALGATEHWSSQGLYRHLVVLQGLVPKANEAAARTWIEAFFFRAAAMLPPGKKLVLSLGQSVPPTTMISSNMTTVGGFIDYTVVAANGKDAEKFLKRPNLKNLKEHDHALFVSEAKSKDVSLENHVPQATCEMYACARTLGKSTIRGALTNGHDWIFLVVRMDADGKGAAYAESDKVGLMVKARPDREDISFTFTSTIAGIIAHWIEHSNDDIGDDDWFTVEWDLT
ncbi:hypothetical protein FA13DRAFT_1777814 [Coprinellus micaceus]|uniref:Uncharacterized protein n=1 Tax=Coprinellus micaceus TaxID=71717 RepID=A0A4Y7SRU0_COPMI|nr:hypothetical protein FA13DRAFT_1777814 [Coprinellus micaceus]